VTDERRCATFVDDNTAQQYDDVITEVRVPSRRLDCRGRRLATSCGHLRERRHYASRTCTPNHTRTSTGRAHQCYKIAGVFAAQPPTYIVPLVYLCDLFGKNTGDSHPATGIAVTAGSDPSKVRETPAN